MRADPDCRVARSGAQALELGGHAVNVGVRLSCTDAVVLGAGRHGGAVGGGQVVRDPPLSGREGTLALVDDAVADAVDLTAGKRPLPFGPPACGQVGTIVDIGQRECRAGLRWTPEACRPGSGRSAQGASHPDRARHQASDQPLRLERKSRGIQLHHQAAPRDQDRPPECLHASRAGERRIGIPDSAGHRAQQEPGGHLLPLSGADPDPEPGEPGRAMCCSVGAQAANAPHRRELTGAGCTGVTGSGWFRGWRFSGRGVRSGIGRPAPRMR